jgi:glutamyl-tRNA reductase
VDPEFDLLGRVRVRFATFRDSTPAERQTLADALAVTKADERVLLETCHRVELVTVERGDVGEPALRGTDAVRRVFEVAGGLDSAIVAEEQVLGQVRAAHEAALRNRSTGPMLNELFRRAIRFGRRVRTHALPGTDRSLADPAIAWLDARLEEGAAVMVAGTGEMARILAMRLVTAGHPVTVASRSAQRASRLADALQGHAHRALAFPIAAEEVAAHDGIALAVRGREPLLTDVSFGDGRRPWVLDLSTPSAVSPAAATWLGARLMDVDRLGAEAGRVPVLSPVAERRLRAELDAEVERFAEWVTAREGARAISVLRAEADAIRRRHLDRLPGRAGLSDAQMAAVEAATASMLGELLHGPSVELRRDGTSAATVRRLFGLGG